MLIRVRFMKNEMPSGREYTYRSQIPVEVGDLVQLPNNGTGIVTAAHVPETEAEAYKDKLKEIVGKKLKRPEKLNNFLMACLERVQWEHTTMYAFFKNYGISEQEVDECFKYLESNEGINI